MRPPSRPIARRTASPATLTSCRASSCCSRQPCQIQRAHARRSFTQRWRVCCRSSSNPSTSTLRTSSSQRPLLHYYQSSRTRARPSHRALSSQAAFHTALRLLQRHLNEPSVAIDAVDFLRCLLSFAPAEAVAAFTNADGLRWTLRMMGAHRQRLDVQEACCSILWSCALDPATSSTHPLLQPSNEDLQAALLPLEHLQQQESPRLARVHRAACGLLWTLSHRPTHARALCAPCWVSLIASCSVSRVDDSRVLEYMCGIASNILAAGAGAGTTAGQLSPVAAVRRFAEGSVVINDDGVRCEDVM